MVTGSCMEYEAMSWVEEQHVLKGRLQTQIVSIGCLKSPRGNATEEQVGEMWASGEEEPSESCATAGLPTGTPP